MVGVREKEKEINGLIEKELNRNNLLLEDQFFFFFFFSLRINCTFASFVIDNFIMNEPKKVCKKLCNLKRSCDIALPK